jgi:hypothetical protein
MADPSAPSGGGFDWGQLLSMLGMGGLSALAAGQSHAGQVNMTNTTSPYGPSTQPRQDIMAGIMNYLNTAMPQGWDQPGGGAPGAAGTFGGYQNPAGAPGGAGGGGGGGGGGSGAGGPNAGFAGQSGPTQQSIAALLARGQAGDPMQGPALGFINQYLSGQDPNAYRAQTFQGLQGMAAGQGNQNLSQFIAQLQAGNNPFGGKALAGPQIQMGGMPAGGGFAAPVSGAAFAAPVGAADYIKQILSGTGNLGSLFTQDNPAHQAMLDATTRDLQRQYATQTVPGVNQAAQGAGLFGSTMYQDALSKSAGQYSESLGGMVGKLNYDQYNQNLQDRLQALHEGAAMDTSAMSNQAQLAAAQISGSASAGAAYYSTNAQLAIEQARLNQQAQLAGLSALAGGIGQQGQMQESGFTGMGNQANAYGGEQLGALGETPAISNMDIAGLQAAGQLSLGSDQARNSYIQSQLQNRAAMAGISLGRSQLGFAQQQYWNPLNQMGLASNVLEGLTNPFSSTNQQGYNYGGSQPPNPLQQGIAGALAGAGMGGQNGSIDLGKLWNSLFGGDPNATGGGPMVTDPNAPGFIGPPAPDPGYFDPGAGSGGQYGQPIIDPGTGGGDGGSGGSGYTGI